MVSVDDTHAVTNFSMDRRCSGLGGEGSAGGEDIIGTSVVGTGEITTRFEGAGDTGDEADGMLGDIASRWEAGVEGSGDGGAFSASVDRNACSTSHDTEWLRVRAELALARCSGMIAPSSLAAGVRRSRRISSSITFISCRRRSIVASRPVDERHSHAAMAVHDKRCIQAAIAYVGCGQEALHHTLPSWISRRH